MSDPGGRLLLVLMTIALAGAAGLAARRRSRRRRVTWPGLSGVVLFTAAGCDTCDRAQTVLTSAGVGFTQVRWEERPDLFHRHGIGKVPTVGLVDAGGRGWASEGVPDPARLPRPDP